MSAALAPRAVFVTRPTDLDHLVEEHGTREQARFMTHDRPGWFDEAVRRHELQRFAVASTLKALPPAWRRVQINRDDLATFAFAPEDVVVPIGQDGLVANLAKYLDRQPVLGVNPDPENVEGLLVRFHPREFAEAIRDIAEQSATIEERTLVEARLDDGQVLRALNEIFVGHRSHQSARYRLRLDDREERQSSSGLIVASGTGATGWARSIAHDRNMQLGINATSNQLAVFVREAWPGPGFGTALTAAFLDAGVVVVTSEMGEGGVLFGDGIEADSVRFTWGRRVEIRAATQTLHLVSRAKSFDGMPGEAIPESVRFVRSLA